MSSEDNKLQRAHQLSALGATLSRPPDADASTLRKARDAYQEAADLFEAASATADDATRQTVRMLLLQHRKLARDLDRRIAGLAAAPSSPISPSSPNSSSPSGSTSPFSVAGPSRTSNGAPTGSRRHSGAAVGLSAGTPGVYSRPGLVHATSPPRVPPFSLRPVDSVPPPPPSGPFSGNPNSPRELYSSSSSSEPPDESFLLPHAVPDTHDPFSRFWGMLENMLEEISIPRAMATAPPELLTAAPPERAPSKSKSKTKSRAERSPSPSESFYVVPRGRERREPDDDLPRNASPTAKTNEELMLENESMRTSLDTLSKIAHQLEVENRALKERAEERDKMMRSVVSGVRREAQKVRHDTEVMRSQMLASTAALSPAQQAGPSVTTLKKRVGELEDEVRQLKDEKRLLNDENSKLRTQLEKFKEKWDKLKAKKEAKVAAAKMARASKSPEPAP